MHIILADTGRAWGVILVLSDRIRLQELINPLITFSVLDKAG